MKILVSNNALNRMALCVCLLSTLSIARGAAQAVPVPASPESFDMDTSKTASVGGGVQFGEFLGRRAIDLPAGLLNVKGANFRDGTVEVDVASKPRGLFMGLAFRVESAANMEFVYLRPSASDTIEAVQYTPRLNGDVIWQLLNSSHEKATAHLPANQWVHLKILVRGRTCQVFVNESKVPTLTVTNLRRGDSEGGIGLWALGGGGYFSNLRYQPLPERKPLPSLPPFQRAGLLSDWELSPVFDAGDVDAGQYPAFLNQWEKVQAEEPGFVLVNRYRTSPALFPMPPREEMRKGRVKGAKVVFARTTLPSAKGSEHLLKIGYSDDIVVYLNRKRVFSGKNALTYRDDGALGVFGLNDEIPIHLQPGENELLVAVTEYNGGWAFECELHPVGVKAKNDVNY
jgi:3-keto-disaccharide hydrolase